MVSVLGPGTVACESRRMHSTPAIPPAASLPAVVAPGLVSL